MSDEDDDYMSCDFLANIEDVKPGVSASREGKRLLRINSRQEDASERMRREKPKSKDELEKQKLEEGINEPISSDSKGFKLLALMGYKEGMSLGQKNTAGGGIKEPILMQVKTDRSGIGLNEERKEKQKAICEAHFESMKRRARMEEELADDFRRRKRVMAEQKQLISDIHKLRKTCQEMDVRLNKDFPDEFWFWPIYSNKGGMITEIEENNAEEPIKTKNAKTEQIGMGEEEEETHIYSNGKGAPAKINLYEFDNQWLRESLKQIVSYMRHTHLYCVYCGCDFSSSDEMQNHCPGPSREGHEE